MSIADPAQGSAASLAALQAALAAARAAPAQSAGMEEDENADIATPRAKAASALEAALKARLEWHWDRDERAGEQLCRLLIDMCAWHEHADLRGQILDLQERGIALLAADPDGQPGMGEIGEIEDDYQAIKPSEDDAEAIAAALGMSLEEARAFGLVGTLSGVGFDDEEPAQQPVAAGLEEPEPEVEEDLETLFRREALNMATRTIPQALQRFWASQQSMDALLAVRRGFHTLKGDARVTAQSTGAGVAEELEGLAVLSEAAEDIIDYLLGDEYDTQQPAPPLPAGAFSTLNETVSAIARRLEARGPLADEAALLRRLEGMQRKAAAQSGVPIDEATLAAKMPPPPVKQPAQPARKPAAASKSSTHSLLPTFLEEADRLMPDLHRALAALSTDAADEGALVRARVKLHTLKGGAALIGDEAAEIQKVAHSAEDLFELIEDFQLRGEMHEVPKEVLDGVLDAEDALQSLIDILRRRGKSGRLPVSPLLPIPPDVLAMRLDAIAERMRRGDLRRPRVEIPAIEPPEVETPAPEAVVADPAPEPPVEVTEPQPPVESAPLLQRVVVPPPPRKPVPTAIGIREISFRDSVERSDTAEVRSRTATLDRIRSLEDRARGAAVPFTLFTCVQQLSHYVAEQARYRELVGRHGQIYVFGKLDAIPAPVERITIVPLEDGDHLAAERLAILDMPEHAAAFFAVDVAADSVDQGRRFLSLQTDDAVAVREAAVRLRAALRQDASLLAVRSTGVQEGAGPGLVPLPRLAGTAAGRRRSLPQEEPRRRPPEYGKEYSVRTALSALEDLSVSRDALQELVATMTAQSVESRRSTTRLRTLVERVGTELAGLRSELVRTTRHTGDWDLLEKEEYTTVDVLLMQLDEALADLEESDTNLRRDLAEARAQVEIQADNQLRAQRALLDMSMIPLSQIEDRLHHAVRSQSRRLNKQVVFSLEGGDLLLDGRIAESLFEPLMHLINNALDHGIEEKTSDRTAAGKTPEGHVTIRGRAGGDGVILEVIDDGRGIDPERVAAVAVSRGIVAAAEAATMSAEERIALIWRPGFSTARSVTSISGRGMGMKSVVDDITSLQGSITVSSVVGKGTTYTIALPRSLAMLRVELVREGKDLVAVPISQMVATHPIRYRDLSGAASGQQVEIGGRSLCIYGAHLANGPAGDGEAGQAVLIEVSGRDGGIVVDDVIGSQYLPVRPAPGYLRRHCGLLGYAVGGGGRILPILDLPTVIDRAAINVPVMDEVRERPAYSVLVVDDSQTMRRALRDTLTKADFLVREAADGREALTTCTRAMPDLITLDMEMPGMDGLEALSALRLLPNGGAAVPVFMITSRQQARHRAAALAAGVTRYFTKPYDTDELIGAAQLVLAEGLRQQREEAS